MCRGLLNGNEQPYCICSLNEFGDRCHLAHDQYHSNPCQNNGACLSTMKSNQFYCLCDDYHYGDVCQFEKRAVRLYVNRNLSHRAAVVQYFDIDFLTLNLLLVHQRIYLPLSDRLLYLHAGNTAPTIILVKLYSNTQSEIHLISIQIEVDSINGTIEINRCVDVRSLFPINSEVTPFQYHQPCLDHSTLLCFIDPAYLCICDENHRRSECFPYDHHLDQCSSCLSGGQCLKEDPWKSNFVCLCPRCYYGSLCQYDIEGMSFTLDSLFNPIDRAVQIVYFVFALMIFLVGGITNYASLVTFSRPNLRQSSMGIYISILSIIGQYSLFSLLMKIILVLFDLLTNDITCKIASFLHSVLIRCLFWLTSWIAIERVSYLLFPFSTILKKTTCGQNHQFVYIYDPCWNACA